MTEKNCCSEIPPGFATPLANIVPRSTNPPPSSITQTPTVYHQSEKSMDDFARRGLGRPRKQQRVISAEAPSMATPAIPLPTVPPVGSSINTPLVITDEEQRDTKINLNPLSLLSPPPNPRLRANEVSSSHINKESMTIISHVKSVLVFQLTSGSTKNVEAMVKCANNAFFNLDFLEADYTSFYKDVKDFITYHFDLLVAKRQRSETHDSFPTDLKTRYEEAMIRANDLKDEIFQTQGHIAMVMRKKESFKRQIAEAMELISKLKDCVAVLKQEENALNHEKQKGVAAYEIATHEVQKICSQVEAAKNVLREIDQRENAAINGIESALQRLKSIHS